MAPFDFPHLQIDTVDPRIALYDDESFPPNLVRTTTTDLYIRDTVSIDRFYYGEFRSLERSMCSEILVLILDFWPRLGLQSPLLCSRAESPAWWPWEKFNEKESVERIDAGIHASSLATATLHGLSTTFPLTLR